MKVMRRILLSFVFTVSFARHAPHYLLHNLWQCFPKRVLSKELPILHVLDESLPGQT